MTSKSALFLALVQCVSQMADNRLLDTKDPDLQRSRNEILTILAELEKKVQALEEDDFYNQVCARIAELADSMAGPDDKIDFSVSRSPGGRPYKKTYHY